MGETHTGSMPSAAFAASDVSGEDGGGGWGGGERRHASVSASGGGSGVTSLPSQAYVCVSACARTCLRVLQGGFMPCVRAYAAGTVAAGSPGLRRLRRPRHLRRLWGVCVCVCE